MNKKLILIILILVFIIGVGAFLFFNRKPSMSGNVSPTSGTPFGTIPNGSGIVDANFPDQNSFNNQTNTISVSTSNGVVIEKIVSQPVAGFTFLGTGTSTSVRFIERGSGKVFDIDLANPSSILQKVSTDTQSRIVSAYILNKGKDLIRFKENNNGTIDALYSTLISTSTSQGRVLGGTILAFSPNFSNDKGLFVVQNGPGSIVSLSNADGSGAKKIWSGMLQDISPVSIEKDRVILQNKPANGLYGAAFEIISGNLKKILDGQSGFKANFNKNASYALFSDYSNTNSPIQIFNGIKNERKELFIQTLPEKCVWSKTNPENIYCFEFDGRYNSLPDDWYLGKTYLDSNNLWKISAKTTQEIVLADMSQVKEPTDATMVSLSPDESFIGFINKRDGSLWVIDLSKTKSSF